MAARLPPTAGSSTRSTARPTSCAAVPSGAFRWPTCATASPDLGVIHYPVLGLTLSAETGSGLWVDGKPASRDARFDAARVVAVGENTRWEPEAIAEVELHLRKARWGVTGYRCASISLGFAALGRVDGYIERYTSLWDLAGGVVIAAEAGLTVRWGGEIKPQGLWVIAGTPTMMDAIAPIQTSITD